MSANQHGEDGEGTAMLVLPGLMCAAGMFDDLARQIPGLCAAPDYGDCDTLAAMADRVLAATQGRFGLFGHSMGARVALEVYRRAPERVARIVLANTGTHDVQPGEADKRHALRNIGRTRGMAALVDAWLPPMVGPVGRRDDALMGRLRDMCTAAGIDRFEAQVNALLTRPSVDALLPTIHCPVLVACGDADVWSPPEQHRAIAAAVPGARLAIIADAGHMMPAETPAAFAEVIGDWITATPIPRSSH